MTTPKDTEALVAEMREAGEGRTAGPWTLEESETFGTTWIDGPMDSAFTGGICDLYHKTGEDGQSFFVKQCATENATFIAYAGTNWNTIADTLEAQSKALAERDAEIERLREVAYYCRPEVQGFARLMEAALRSKDAERGGNSWQNQTLAWEILPHLQHQVAILKEHISDATKASDEFDADIALSDASAHAVHAANFAMMICDLSGTLPRATLKGTTHD